MKAFARLIVRRSVATFVVLFVLGVSALSAFYAGRVIQDDDILAFLPKDNPDVVGFREVAARYGSLDVALVGIETPDVFSPSFVSRLQKATKELNETEGVQYALSITSVEDFAPNPERGGITTDYLVREVPTSESEQAALRAKVLSRDHVVTNLVDADGKAIMIYCFAVPGAQPREVAERVRQVVLAHFPDEPKYWHGSPFISTYIYDTTQRDLRRLAPWACAAIALLLLLSFRDLIATGLSLLSTSVGILVPLGVMGAFGIHNNIVLGSMPVILFALGSAYGIHIMSRFYAHRTTLSREESVERAVNEVAPAVLGSGLTTVVGLLSFVMMDIAPLRTFGIFTSLGLLIALLVAVVFIPAVLTLTPIKPKTTVPLPTIARLSARLSGHAVQRRWAYGIVAALVSLASLFFVTRVDTRLDTTAFFDPGSPPAQADLLMQRHFGGSSFVQIELTGDMTDPAVLRELQALADRIRVLDGVTSVNHIGAIVAQTNEAMNDVRRIPETSDQVKLLYGFLTGKQAVSMTITDDRKQALLHVKLISSRAEDIEKILVTIERITHESVPADYVVASRLGPLGDQVATKIRALAELRVLSLARSFGAEVGNAAELSKALQEDAAPKAAVAPLFATLIRSQAFEAPLPADAPADAADQIGLGLAKLGAPPKGEEERKAYRAKVPELVAQVLGKDASDPAVDDTSLALEHALSTTWSLGLASARSQAVIDAAAIRVPESDRGTRFRRDLGHALLDLDSDAALVRAAPSDAAAAKLSTRVTGLPVLYRGLSNSVFNNQWNSLWFALVLVIGLKVIVFRSLWAGFLSSIPTLVTLAVIYGIMGVFGVHLDIGTSMLASLIIGAGDDYAVEYLWAWVAPKDAALEVAARAAATDTAAAIWTNAAMMAVGFFVLTLGDARPLKNVGGLTAAAMVAAALATFIICPILARRRSYAPGVDPDAARDLDLEASEAPAKSSGSTA